MSWDCGYSLLCVLLAKVSHCNPEGRSLKRSATYNKSGKGEPGNGEMVVLYGLMNSKNDAIVAQARAALLRR